MKRIIAVPAIAGSLFIAACGMFGPVEKVQQQPNKTVYRAAGENPFETPSVTPAPQKVPGEKR
jgi:hypothetical protein